MCIKGQKKICNHLRISVSFIFISTPQVLGWLEYFLLPSSTDAIHILSYHILGKWLYIWYIFFGTYLKQNKMTQTLQTTFLTHFPDTNLLS